MPTSVHFEGRFHNEEVAYAFVESRVWPKGPVCPRCGGFDRIGKLQGQSTRIGVHKCYECRKPFTVKVGTIFESSHVPLHIWLQAIHLLCSGKKRIGANRLHRILGVTVRTAGSMRRRIRAAMREGTPAPSGGDGGAVTAAEQAASAGFHDAPVGATRAFGASRSRRRRSAASRCSRSDTPTAASGRGPGKGP